VGGIPGGRRAWRGSARDPVVRPAGLSRRPGLLGVEWVLPAAVLVTVAALVATSVLAGAASVRAVGTQDRLVRLTSMVTRVVAESGRAEALVAGLADPNTNPAELFGMRTELAASARSIAAAAAVLSSDPTGVPQASGRLARVGVMPEDVDTLRLVLRATNSQLPTLTRDFAAAAASGSREGAQLTPGSLLRGGVDGIYPALRSDALRVVRVLLTDAEAQRRSWARTVEVSVLSLAVTGLLLAALVVGPVRVRLRRQRLAAAQLAQADRDALHARNDALTRHAAQLAAIGRATAAILRQDDARATVCEAARSVCGAAVVTLLEDDGTGHLACTAAAGAEVVGLRMSLSGRSMAAEVFLTGITRTALVVTGDDRFNQGMVDYLSQMCGTALDAGAWIPVVTGGRCRGVLVLGFPAGAGIDGHLPVLEILAEETAVALERHDIMRQLAADAGTDPLTAVANRRAWDLNLTAALAEARVNGRPLCVVILDLDRFKQYNDEHGHPAGDALLRTVADRWRARLRPGDLLARYGGEEFTVLLPSCRLAGATQVADELRSLMPAPQTCSAGAAQWDGSESAVELVARADRALYDAKRAGRDRTTTAVH
jgi:diguanylate cyclase (GGDEF)-like protein